MKHHSAPHESRGRRLVDELGLLRLAEDACASAAIPGREQQLAYCLVALADKADPPRSKAGGPAVPSYGLDPDAGGVAERLQRWAGVIAGNLRMWGPTYEAIRAEADDYRLDTLRGLIHARSFDDVADRMALELALVLAGGPPLEEMSLARAYEEPAAPNDYVFQRPLRQWIASAVSRVLPRDVDDLDAHLEVPAADDGIAGALERAAATEEDVLGLYIEGLSRLAGTRGLLAEAIARADAFELRLARLRPSSGSDPALVGGVRAALLYESDRLQHERRAVDGVLAYVLLAMRAAEKLQRVAVLSLRLETIDRRASAVLEEGMRRVLEEERQPTPALLGRTVRAAAASAQAVAAGAARVAVVPASRPKALAAIPREPERRRLALAPVARMLRELPARVSDDRAIAAHEGIERTNVTTYRRNAAEELAAVDVVFGRVFRRYAGGRA